MTSTISQSQRIASLLLMKLPKFVGDVQAGGQRAWCQAWAKPPSQARRVVQAVPAPPELPMAGRRETRSTLHTLPAAAAKKCVNVMGLSWCG